MPTIMIGNLSEEEKKRLDIAKIEGGYDNWREMILDHREVSE